MTSPTATPLDPFRDWRRSDHPLRQGLVMVEGVEAVRWLCTSQLAVVAIAGKPTALQALKPEIDHVAAPHHSLARPELAALLGFPFDRGVVALAQRPEPNAADRALAALAASPRWRLLACDAVHDATNLGALVRSARCLGCDGLLLGPGGADPLSRRVVRTGVGHPLHLPTITVADLAQTITGLAAGGAMVVAAHRGPQSIALGSLTAAAARWILVVGNEDRGPRPETVAACPIHAALAMAPGMDSLNVAAAAAIGLHHLRAIDGGDPGPAGALLAFSPGRPGSADQQPA